MAANHQPMVGDLVIRPVVRENWADFETFFESHGKLNNCWCMAWRMTAAERGVDTPAGKKELIRARVWAGVPIGLLAYAADRPVAWCSVSPRETFRRLGGEESLPNVWSITCFYIESRHRRAGLAHALIGQAKIYAAQNGANYVEAYPVDPDSPSYRFMGYVSTFEKEGFRYMKDAGSRRHVMVCAL